ncbi:ABC transporter substrate-binding protein [Maledivibacter halophilus]|uniref:Peptide/nickel transport system substrate-binding protein n=1 Tax=Maledivibacter halophilus TaxID=36842 RepID=A0A1T5MD69_9FIRM|nr:ABC transporter substrate-binding protein [Maledivibacter halophilus]SKC86170.1 peptide/nickel transport system substrate-binding protein [Maledivibacter halophilus]
MKLKKIIVIMLALVMVLSLAACGNNDENNTAKETSNQEASNQEPKEGKKIFKYGNDLGALTGLDVHLFTTSEVFEVSEQTHEALIGVRTGTYELYPLLITEMPKVSEDGLTYSFELKKGIKFHDGSELTSHDVKYTLERIFTPSVGNVNTWICDMIKGSKEMLEGEATELSGFKLIDDYKFEISLYEPYAPFEAVMATTQMVIFPEEAESYGKDWGLKTYIGTGPLKLKEFQPKVKVMLERFDDYHGEVAKLDELHFLNMEANTALLEFEKGNIHLARVQESLVDQYKDDEKLKDKLREQNLIGIIALTLNHEKPPLDDVRVRKAVSLAVDRKSLAENYLKGNVSPAKSMLPPGVLGYDPDAPELEYNPEKAKELLAEAGYPDGVELTSVVSEKNKLVGVFTVLQAQLKEAGITLNIQQVDKPSYVDLRKRGEIQMPILTWYADYVDPDNFLYTFLYKENSVFFSSNYKNEEFNKLAEEGRRIANREEREELYKKLDYKVVHEDLPHSPLYTPKAFYMEADNVDGLEMQNFTFRFYNTDLK